MNRQQITALYDSFTPEQQNMPREQFIKRAMSCVDPVKNQKIVDAMVDRKRQVRQGQVQKAVIDSAITRGKKR